LAVDWLATFFNSNILLLDGELWSVCGPHLY
jgi:hypothetical protein